MWTPTGKIVAVLYALISAAALLRDELISPEQQQEWKLLALALHWGTWHVWAIVGLALLLVIALEGSYRVVRRRDETVRALEARLANPRVSQAVLSILYAPEPPMRERWVYRVMIRNSGLVHAEDVKVRLRRVIPHPLREWVSLPRDLFPMHTREEDVGLNPCRIAAGSEEFFPVIASPPHGPRFVVGLGRNAHDGQVSLKLGQRYEAEIEASAANAPAVRQTFDIEKRLLPDRKPLLLFAPQGEPLSEDRGISLPDHESPPLARDYRRQQKLSREVQLLVGSTSLTIDAIEALPSGEREQLFARNPGLREWCAGE